MGGQHDLHNHQISVKIPHQVWRQIEIQAAAGNQKPSEFIRDVVTLRVSQTPLTAEDAKLIAERIALAEQKGKMV